MPGTLENKFEKSSRLKNVNFFPGKGIGVGFSPQQQCFGLKHSKIKLEIEASDWLMIFCKQTQ